MNDDARLRVLHVIYKIQPTNGQFNEHCVPLAEERAITVCSFRPSTLPIPPTIRAFEGSGSFRSGWRALVDALRSNDHDVVHVHAAQTSVILLAAMAVSRTWRFRRRAVYTVQNSYQNYKRQNRLLMALAFPWYQQVVFCSGSARESMPRWMMALRRGASHVVANCVDLSAIDAARESEVPAVVPTTPGRFRVVVLGRLIPIKDVATAIRAVAALPGEDVELVIIGDGELRSELDALVADLGIDKRVTFTGLLTRPEVHRQIATADAYLSASLGEGLPVAVIEALAGCCPAVLSDIPPHRELSAGLSSVQLFPIHNVPAATAALARLVDLDPADRAALGERSRHHVEQHYSLTAMHRAYEPIYDAARPPTGRRALPLKEVR